MAHAKLMENGCSQLHFLALLAQENGAWKNPVLCRILSQESLDQDEGEFILDSIQGIASVIENSPWKESVHSHRNTVKLVQG